MLAAFMLIKVLCFVRIPSSKFVAAQSGYSYSDDDEDDGFEVDKDYLNSLFQKHFGGFMGKFSFR